MLPNALLSLLILPALGAVPSSALRINCGDCNAFQAIQVILDGEDIKTDASVQVVGIAPGRHDLKLVKWVNPFKTETYYEGVVDFPAGTELRAKVTKGKLDIYGRGQYAPPTPPRADFAPPRIVQGVRMADGSPAVRVSRRVTLTGMKGAVFHHGCRLRARGGEWGAWTSSQEFTVPSDPFTTELSWDHPYSSLDEINSSRGRFVIDMSVFDRANTLATSETAVEVPRRYLQPDEGDDDDDEEEQDRPRHRHHRRH
ncbi:MAG TPA: hypothetical protein VGK67_24075 [Myxococcales bacterium]|jgi:hypothetical protein